MRIQQVASAVVMVTALAGCAGGAAAKPAVSTTSTATVPVTTTSSVDAKLFSAAAATSEVKILALKSDLVGCLSPPDDFRGLSCMFIVMRAPIEGKNAAKAIRDLGDPPSEIAGPVAATLAKADALGAVDVQACTSLKSNYGSQWADVCARPQMDSSLLTDDLLAQLAGLKVAG